MNCDKTNEAILEIGLIAETQAELVEKANASPKHTEMVLREIAQRCTDIPDGKVSFDPAELIADDDDGRIAKMLDGVVGVVEATREEESYIWSRFVQHREPPMTWKQDCGIGITIGYLDGRPIHVSLTVNEANGHRILFYHATSELVDHKMVRNFIDAIVPETAKKGDRTNHTDACNFANVLPHAAFAE